MNSPRSKLRARLAPQTRFEPRPAPAALARGQPEADLDRLKERLLRQLLRQTAAADLHPPLRRAASEAASLAWLTPFPLLVLPVLLHEKAEVATQQATRQRTILRHGPGRWAKAA
jgi:hypothetical protein